MPDTTYLYPFDPAGNKISNRIVGEQHVMSPPSWKDFHFIIPNLAPFFEEGLSITNAQTNEPLVKGVDYYLGHRFMDASRATAKPIYGSIILFDKTFSGVLTIDQYQTLGGEWTVDGNAIAEVLMNKQLNPRITSWEQVFQTPHQFPVIDHEWNLHDMVGMSAIKEALDGIADVVLARAGNDQNLSDHINDHDNPHGVTKTHLDLEHVENFPMASKTVMETGSSDQHYASPRGVRYAIEKFAHGYTDEHVNNTNNPHETNKGHVGLSELFNYPVAALEDILTGSPEHYVTAYGVNVFFQSVVAEPFNDHVNNSENPHGTNKTHVGLEYVENFPMANETESINGVRNDRYASPESIKTHVDNRLSDYYTKIEVDALLDALRQEFQ